MNLENSSRNAVLKKQFCFWALEQLAQQEYKKTYYHIKIFKVNKDVQVIQLSFKNVDKNKFSFFLVSRKRDDKWENDAWINSGETFVFCNDFTFKSDFIQKASGGYLRTKLKEFWIDFFRYYYEDFNLERVDGFLKVY
ncbi:hypothetical protein [Mycoplasma seminis]|uniref:Uncharacterized protein n=1 Tax=Mycoplasma seminis TaxID=512749 RepID=A0ABY9H9R5_9MOLU|nr:hypothetical protein [Mycoplasma seminis]WLP85272.1 hypothetical protein Q8852_03035 [Mycoplasma seminis]